MSPALFQAWERTWRRRAAERAVVQAANGESRTFRELESGARAWLAKHAPADFGALAGRAVVFAGPNGIGWLEIFLGLLRTGAIILPLDAAEPPSAQRELALRLRAGFWWDGGRLVACEGARRFRDPAVCLVKLTSGTTGRPRALAFTAAQLLADARQVTATMGITPRDLNYALIPLGHSYGLGSLTVPLLARGVPLVCGAAALPHAIAADFARWRPTVFPGVPAVWEALAASGVAPAMLNSLRLAISAGAPLAPAAARAFAARFGRPLHAFYGSSETGGISFDRSGEATLFGGVGRPLRGVRVAALPGKRIRVCSAAVFTQANRRRCGRHGCWTPADRAVADGRGELTLLGRLGATVKIAGRRVNPAEIAARLRGLEGVRDAWVAASPGAHPLLGTVVATGRTEAELRAGLRSGAAAWKIPKKWVVVRSLPLTPMGKTDARALRAMLFPSGGRSGVG
jgi:acyl-CoA synthetase (AMP-forming)/AMP-acid ligase II